MNVLIAVLIVASVAALVSQRPPRWLRDPLQVGNKATPRRILVTGATGFIGQRLCRKVVADGDHLFVFARNVPRARDLFGPHATIISSLQDIPADSRIDAIINLAGEPIFARAWTKQRRQELLQSRLQVTESIEALIGRLVHKPEVLISASAVGYYGVRGDEELCETDRGQTIFQSQLCQLWELAAQRAEAHGVRVCRLRLGVVLGRDGGALPAQVRAARARTSTRLGTGAQWISWIHVDDVLRLIDHCIGHRDCQGAINATAPVPVRQKEFADGLAAQFGRALPIQMPAALLRRLLGERAQLLVDGQRVLPVKALASGFEFRYPRIDLAFADICGSPQELVPADVLYDSLCPVCDAEMKGYCRAARSAGRPWRFDDVATRTELMNRYRIDLPLARRRVYVLTSSGRMLSGIEALCVVWAGLPNWRWLAQLVRLPLVEPLAARFYDMMLAPMIWRWNLRRRGSDHAPAVR